MVDILVYIVHIFESKNLFTQIADFGHLDGPFRKEGNPYMKDGEGLDYGFVRWLCKEAKIFLSLL